MGGTRDGPMPSASASAACDCATPRCGCLQVVACPRSLLVRQEALGLRREPLRQTGNRLLLDRGGGLQRRLGRGHASAARVVGIEGALDRVRHLLVRTVEVRSWWRSSSSRARAVSAERRPKSSSVHAKRQQRRRRRAGGVDRPVHGTILHPGRPAGGAHRQHRQPGALGDAEPRRRGACLLP